MDQMQVLVVTSDYPPEVGGMAEYSDAWCRELADQGFDVSVINQTSSPATEGRNPAIPSETVTWPQSPRLFPLYAYQTLKTALELKKPDFVFAHTWIGWAPALSYLKGKMQGLKYVVSAHGAEIIGPAQSTYYRFLMKTGLKGADLILPVSQFTAEHVSQLGISKERIRVVGNGVDIQKYNSTTPSPELLRKYKLENCQILLTVGGLVERKGHDVVIRALAKIKDDYPKLRYLICGGWALDSSRESYLRNLIKKLKLEDRVIFTGFVNDDVLPEIYNLADIFIMTGKVVPEKGWVEGFGISYLEAAACGVPIIATPSGGSREAITDENSLVVPPDDVSSTAEAIGKLLDDRDQLDNMSRAGIDWAKTNSWPNRVHMGTKIFKELINE